MIILGVKTTLKQDRENLYQLPDGTYKHDLVNFCDLADLCSAETGGKLGCIGPLSQRSEDDVFVLGYLLCHRGTDDLMPEEINIEKLAYDVQQLRPSVLEDLNSHGFNYSAEEIHVYHAIDNELWHL